MINKKILWTSGAGAVAVSIAVAITINVVINNQTDQPASKTLLTCMELQQKINKLGRPGFDLLPEEIKENIRDMRQDHTCNLIGKDWSLNLGNLQTHITTQTNMHDGKVSLEDF